MREVCTDPPRPASDTFSTDDPNFRRGPDDRDLDLDVVFDVLGKRWRRIVLHHLRSREREWVPVADVVEHVLAWESELGDSSVSAGTIETAFVHQHLPKLDATGVIEYDASRGRIAYRGSERVGRFLDLSLREGPLP